jgi:hypothetical protein
VRIQLIQKQIMRGEECYHDETQFNVYRGWDGYTDARVDAGGGSSAAHGASSSSSQTGGVYRRMPPDHRWFSNSPP